MKDRKPGIYGKLVSCEELFDEIMKDELFYRRQNGNEGLDAFPGEVTYSGGETLLQAERLEPLFRRLKDWGIHQCVETALFVPEEKLALAMEYIDFFYVDIKILDSEQCRVVLHGDLVRCLTNVRKLFAAQKPVVFRVPVIGGYTDIKKNCQRVMELIKNIPL